MYTYEQQCVINLADSYTLMYGFIGRSLCDRLGIPGEGALRQACRLFGYDRAEKSRARHLAVGAKINMLNLFTLYHDLPGDPRFRRELQEINPRERVSHTLVCPMADIWKEYGQRDIGRIYCEEFHPACYGHYAFDYGQVNLSRTLTQGNDAYCDFNVALRPEDLPEELKGVCFEEYDPEYVQPKFPEMHVDGKTGFASLSIKLYYYQLKCAAEQLGQPGIDAVREGLKAFAAAAAELFRKRAAQDGHALDAAYVRDNLPMDLDTSADAAYWEGYDGHGAREIMQECLCDPLARALGI